MTLPIRKGATHKVVLGPFLDLTDAATPELGITLGAADDAEAILHDNGTVIDISGYTFAAITTADGYYHLTLQSAISNTVGHLTILVQDDDVCRPVKADFVVMDTGAYDALYASTSTLLTSGDVGLLYESTIGTVSSQTSFLMDDAITTDDNWNGNLCTIEDVTTGEMVSARISDVVQTTDNVQIDVAPVFTVAIGDKVRVFREVHPTTALNSFDPPTRTEATTDKQAILDKLLAYVQLLARSDVAINADNSAELTEINTDGGSGPGDYDNQTDSMEHGNVQNINNTAVTGSGTTTNKWRG